MSFVLGTSHQTRGLKKFLIFFYIWITENGIQRFIKFLRNKPKWLKEFWVHTISKRGRNSLYDSLWGFKFVKLHTTTSAIISVIFIKNSYFNPMSFSNELFREKHIHRFLGIKKLLMMSLKLFVGLDNLYWFGSGLNSQWTMYKYGPFLSDLTCGSQRALEPYLRLSSSSDWSSVLMCGNRHFVSP